MELEDLVDVDENIEACPGCGCMPGDGLTEGCEAESGCGTLRQWAEAK